MMKERSKRQFIADWVLACFVVMIFAGGLAIMATPDAEAQLPGPAWTCSMDNIGATLTLCQPLRSGNRLYLTDIVAQSTTATAGLLLVRYGTGTNCGTDTVSLLPSGATVPRIAYPGTGSPTTNITLGTPVSAPAGNDLCVICTATNTCSLQLSGYAAP